MIIELFYGIIFAPLYIISSALSLITFHVPAIVLNVIQTLMTYLNYLNGWLPIHKDVTDVGTLHASIGLVDLFGWAITIFLIEVVLKLVFLMLRLFPFLGVNVRHTELTKK